MNVNTKLVLDGLKNVRLEKRVQGKILESINSGNYELASYLIKYNDKLCSDTDDICRSIIEAYGEDSIGELNDIFEEEASRKYGKNCSEGLSLYLILNNVYMNDLLGSGIVGNDTILEEALFDVHSYLSMKYLRSDKGLYKSELLDHINNNISRCTSLRALFRGKREEFDRYNPDLYMDFLTAKLAGEDLMKANYLTSCITLDEVNNHGLKHLVSIGIKEDDAKDILKAEKDLQKMKLASFYIQAFKRFFDIRIDINQFSEETKKDIEEGFRMGDNSLREEFKYKKNKVLKK